MTAPPVQVRHFLRVSVFIAQFAAALSAHDIITTKLTYSRDISRIFAQRCAGCHGANASVPLANYDQVRPWAVDIKEQVLSRAMPPWGAVKGFGELKPDWGMTQEEIAMVAAWVVGGAPRGDDKMLPAARDAASPPDAQGHLAGKNIHGKDRIQMHRAVVLVGLRPSAARVESAKIIASLPDGQVIPLVWLYQLNGTHDFFFRAPVSLPEGSIVQSSAPLAFELIESSPGS